MSVVDQLEAAIRRKKVRLVHLFTEWDEDGNGVADVDELTPQELATRKLGLAMRVVKEPDKLQSAVGGLWS